VRTSGLSVIAPNQTTYFSWEDFQLINNDSNDSTTTSYQDAKFSNVATVLTRSLALLVIGAAFCIAHLVHQFIGLLVKKVTRGLLWKLLAALLGFASAITYMLSVFLFTTIYAAFYQDAQICPGQTHSDKDQYCADFYDTENIDDTVAAYTVTWMPWIGWWLCIGAGFFGLISTTASLSTSKR